MYLVTAGQLEMSAIIDPACQQPVLLKLIKLMKPINVILQVLHKISYNLGTL